MKIESHANLFCSITMTTIQHTLLQSVVTTGVLISYWTLSFWWTSHQNNTLGWVNYSLFNPKFPLNTKFYCQNVLTKKKWPRKYHFYCISIFAKIVFKYQNCKCFAQTYCTTLKVDKTFFYISLKCLII